MPQSELLLYQTEDGQTKIEVTTDGDTVWLSQSQMIELFQSSKSNISDHIKRIFEEGELEETSLKPFRKINFPLINQCP